VNDLSLKGSLSSGQWLADHKNSRDLADKPRNSPSSFQVLQESRDNGLSKNGDGGSKPGLKQVQLEELEGPLDHNLYPCAKNVAYHVKKHFGISSSVA